MMKTQRERMIRARIMVSIHRERDRQDQLHGERNTHSPERWLVVLAEEFGEVSHAVLEQDMDNYVEELIHVAAVAVAALECVMFKQEEHG